MNETLKIVLSLSSSLLILFLFLLLPVFKNQLSKRWQYYIWLVVVARLLLPFAAKTNLMGIIFQNSQSDISIQETHTSQNDDVTAGQGSLQGEIQESPVVLAENIFTLLWENLWLCWLFVALILFIRKITIYQSFVKYIRAGCVEVEDINLLEKFGKLVEQTKIKTNVEIHTNDLISSPLLIGFFRACIIFPTVDLSASDFEYTTLHELTHFKRKDMFYKWLVQFAVCLHWFNPLLYQMSREVGRACELSCDEAVIRTLDPKERRAYGDTLVNALRTKGSYNNSLASITLNENKERLKERLDAIMKFKKTTWLTAVISITLTLTLCFGAAVTGTYASTRFFTGGEIAALDELENNETTSFDNSSSAKNSMAAKAKPYTTKQADKRGIQIMKYSGTWGQTMEEVLPYMSNKGIDKAVAIYNKKNPNNPKKASDYYNFTSKVSGTTNSNDSDSFDYTVFNRLDTMTSAEVDALALSYIATTGQFGHIYNFRPYMTTKGIDAAVKAYLKGNGDVGVVLAMLPHMSKATAKTVKEKALNEW